MPTVTLVGAPHADSSAYDPATHTRFNLGKPVDVDDDRIGERLESLRALGYEFQVAISPTAGEAAYEFPTSIDPVDPAGVATAPTPTDTSVAQ